MSPGDQRPRQRQPRQLHPQEGVPCHPPQARQTRGQCFLPASFSDVAETSVCSPNERKRLPLTPANQGWGSHAPQKLLRNQVPGLGMGAGAAADTTGASLSRGRRLPTRSRAPSHPPLMPTAQAHLTQLWIPRPSSRPPRRPALLKGTGGHQASSGALANVADPASRRPVGGDHLPSAPGARSG